MTQVRAELAKRVTKIQQSYTRLWTAFQDAANQQALKAENLDSRGAVVAEKNGIGTASANFLLAQWPFKAVSDKRKVDIVVRVQETFSADLAKVVRATTCVAYLLRKGLDKTSNPLLELHYDFETPVQEAHPLFHAQLGATEWSPEHLAKLGFEGKLVRPDGEHSYANARIPTAFMGFGPILAMLAADHLKHKGYRTVVKALKSVDPGYVDPDCDLLAQGLTAAGVPHAHHWYDDRYIVYTWNEGKNLHKAQILCLNETCSDRDPGKLKGIVAKKLGVAVAEIVFTPRPTQ